MKTCTKCGTTKPLDLFPLDRSSGDGHKGWCKACCNTWARERRARNKPHVTALEKSWRDKNPDKVKKAAHKATQRTYLSGSKKKWWPD